MNHDQDFAWFDDDQSAIRGERFVQVPLWILSSANLTSVELAVYIAMVGHVNREKNLAWPGLPTVGEWAGCSAKTAQRALAKLAEKGLVEGTGRPGSTTMYRVRRTQVDVTQVRESGVPRTESPTTPDRESGDPGQRVLRPIPRTKTELRKTELTETESFAPRSFDKRTISAFEAEGLAGDRAGRVANLSAPALARVAGLAADSHERGLADDPSDQVATISGERGSEPREESARLLAQPTISIAALSSVLGFRTSVPLPDSINDRQVDRAGGEAPFLGTLTTDSDTEYWLANDPRREPVLWCQ